MFIRSLAHLVVVVVLATVSCGGTLQDKDSGPVDAASSDDGNVSKDAAVCTALGAVECGPYTCDSTKTFCLVIPQDGGAAAYYCQATDACLTCDCLNAAGYPNTLCQSTAGLTCSQTSCGITITQQCS